MRIVFFGTPAFAVPALQTLLASGFPVVGVVTQPDRPQGRSRSTLVPPPVKTVAEAAGLPVLQPERPVGDLFLAALRHLSPDIAIVVAYGHILRPEVLALPPRGMLNVHASLLPALRGAAPIPWAILNGLGTTGVSLMQMDTGMDTGAVLSREATAIGRWETAGQLTDRLAGLGALLLTAVLPRVESGEATPNPQDAATATYAPKIQRADARLDWNAPAEQLSRRIRAFDPAPGAWAELDGAEVKLFGACAVPTTVETDCSATPGTVLATDPVLVIATGDGAIAVEEIQPAGKRRMPVAAWAHGRGAAPGLRLS